MKSEISLVTVKKFLMKKKFTAISKCTKFVCKAMPTFTYNQTLKRTCITNEKKRLSHVTQLR